MPTSAQPYRHDHQHPQEENEHENKKARSNPEMTDDVMQVEEQQPPPGSGSIMDVLRTSMEWRKSQAFHQAKLAQQAFGGAPP